MRIIEMYELSILLINVLKFKINHINANIYYNSEFQNELIKRNISILFSINIIYLIMINSFKGNI